MNAIIIKRTDEQVELLMKVELQSENDCLFGKSPSKAIVTITPKLVAELKKAKQGVIALGADRIVLVTTCVKWLGDEDEAELDECDVTALTGDGIYMDSTEMVVDSILAGIEFRSRIKESYFEYMVELRLDDIESLFPDNRLNAFRETYATVLGPTDIETYATLCCSTANVTKEDIGVLQVAAHEKDESMIMGREYGFFVKLFDPEDDKGEDNPNRNARYSDALNAIVTHASECGFRMVEFDCDAPELPGFPTFEH